ncbi:hypothetical protein GDO86_002564 [Hymenochirus boettgeri]|uniref:Ig-like domain-containing protein n=1 Tax=Hymenochirus boettgeri TaxID=247094 RepID=A0A8T2KR41_9PIPI|nr:hypothetical protein GDO86_002564 [Hymenochirus boettgeri]
MKNLLYLSGLLIFTSGNRNVGNNWSFHVPKEVTGEVGKSTTLSCLFSHPQKTHSGPLTAIWRIDHPYNGTVVFKCMSNNSNDPCKPTINRMNKFQLIGNPHSNNLSISIGNLTWDDGNKYYCRVELSSDRHDKYETRTGTQLHLAAPPRIINITIGFDQFRGYHAICIAEGEPAPSLHWTDPLNTNQEIRLTRPLMKHQTAMELHYLTQDGKYTCGATNSHGRVEASVYLFKFKSGNGNDIGPGLLLAGLAFKLLMLLVLLCSAAWYRNGERAQESTYENYEPKGH